MTTAPTLLPAPHGRAYLTRGPDPDGDGERYCLPPPRRSAPLAPCPGVWSTAAAYPAGPAAWERDSALPPAAAAALAALLARPATGRPTRPPATPDAALIADAMARGGYASRSALAVAVAARVEGQTTATAVARALTRACVPAERGWRGGAAALSEEVRGVLRRMAGREGATGPPPGRIDHGL